MALSRSLFPLFLFFFVLFVGLCVVSALCAHLFVSLNYVLFIMACWLVTIKNLKNSYNRGAFPATEGHSLQQRGIPYNRGAFPTTEGPQITSGMLSLSVYHCANKTSQPRLVHSADRDDCTVRNDYKLKV